MNEKPMRKPEPWPGQVHPFEPPPGEIGMGPDELEAIGEIGELLPQGMCLELMALTARLKSRRESMGMSLTDVSERSGMTRQAISKLENGQNANPTLSTLYRYALALDANILMTTEDIGPEFLDDAGGE